MTKAYDLRDQILELATALKLEKDRGRVSREKEKQTIQTLNEWNEKLEMTAEGKLPVTWQ